MATFITTNLTNNGAGAGVTTNYAISYDNTLSAADGVNRGNALMNFCDADYAQMDTLFGNIGTPFSLPISVQLSVGAYAGAGWGPPIAVTPGNGSSGDLVRYLLVSEVVEMFMKKQGSGWGYSDGDSNEGSKGEALSRFLGYYFLSTNGLDLTVLSQGGSTFFVANSWLASARADWVNNNPDDNKPDATTGCTTLFVYYLYSQLKFGIPAIINAGATTLAGVYTSLTGDAGDPFPFFARLIAGAFPGTNQITTGPNFDDPFPLGLLSFWCDNNTFSRDQAKDIVATQAGVVSNAFYLILEGFSADSFNAYGVTVPTPTGGFASLSGIKVRPSPATPGGAAPAQATPIFEDPAQTKAPQRIRFSFDIVFSDESAFPKNVGDAPAPAVLSASAQIGGTDINGATCTAGFELLAGANPYFTNVDPTNAADLAYLSQDLRVFTVTAGDTPLGAPAFTSNAYASIQAFIGHLNGDPAYTQPTTGPDPLNNLPGQGGYETADSSVNPGSPGHTNYNFAIARVRLRGSALDQATNCRVFFRLFVAQSADTDFQPSTTYKSTQGTTGADAGHPIFPLASASGLVDPSGNSLQTIPYFATDIGGTHDYDGTAPNANIRNVQIPASQDQVWAYYGCFLDIYDAAGNANLGGTHHCIVAEIACSEAPIPATTGAGGVPSPLAWDQLAQRNLQITLSENPKSRATHIAPQAFDLRPSKAPVPLPGLPMGAPDELMIDWGRTPPGSVATIYWPGLSATKVLELAHSIYGSHLLSAADGHTIQCVTTRGVTYIPVPHVAGVNFAGLLTIDLPETITHGQVFDILVRRVASRVGHLAPPPPPPPPGPKISVRVTGTEGAKAAQAPVTHAASKDSRFVWRQICGAFQVRIPVTNRKVMLPIEEDTLAVLKWRLTQKEAPYRWRPVWERYIELVANRVKGLGGDPGKIPPSLGGYPGKGHGEGPGRGGGRDEDDHDRDASTGKIDGVVYDRFGDFAGFQLRTERGHERHYRAREAEIERLVLQAWRDRLVVTVVAEDRDRDQHRPRRDRDDHDDRSPRHQDRDRDDRDHDDRHHDRRHDDDERHDHAAPAWPIRIILRRLGG